MKIESLADMTARIIEQMITTDELRPGQQIKEDEIADKLDISRPPVREAFKTLEGQGLVVRKPRKGTFVVEMTEADIREVYTLKASMYALAMDLAMDHITAEQKQGLEDLVDRMCDIVKADNCDILAYQGLHKEFHGTILNISGNTRLKNFATNLHKQIRRFSYQTLHHKVHLERSSDYHVLIIDNILSGNRKTAARVMREHVMDAMEFLLELPDIFSARMTDMAPGRITA